MFGTTRAALFVQHTSRYILPRCTLTPTSYCSSKMISSSKIRVTLRQRKGTGSRYRLSDSNTATRKAAKSTSSAQILSRRWSGLLTLVFRYAKRLQLKEAVVQFWRLCPVMANDLPLQPQPFLTTGLLAVLRQRHTNLLKISLLRIRKRKPGPYHSIQSHDTQTLRATLRHTHTI